MRQFRMADTDFEHVRLAAVAAQLSWSEWVRKTILRAAKRKLKKEKGNLLDDV